MKHAHGGGLNWPPFVRLLHNSVKAAYVSGLVALILVVAVLFISSGGRIYFSEIDWDKVNSMSYEEGQKYLVERSQSISRWESLKNGVEYSAFWLSALADWVLYFVVGFSSCVLCRRFSQSNNQIKPDLGADAPRRLI